LTRSNAFNAPRMSPPQLATISSIAASLDLKLIEAPLPLDAKPTLRDLSLPVDFCRQDRMTIAFKVTAMRLKELRTMFIKRPTTRV
jgi:hypothetical protein